MDAAEEIHLLKKKIVLLQAENLRLKTSKVEIRMAKELYLKIFEEFPALIWRARLDKQCDYFNKNWYEFTGRTVEQEFGNGWAEGVHPDDLQRCLDIYITSFDKRVGFEMEYRLRHHSGTYRWLRDCGRPFYDMDETFLGYIGSCYDITDIKNNENRLIELNATKDKFFTIIGHDLRAPITNCSGLSDFLTKKLDNGDLEGASKVAGMIKDSSNKILSLLVNLLEWSRLQTGKIKFQPEIIDSERIIESTVKLFEVALKDKNITLTTEIEPGETIFADQQMISAVVRNLVSNAIKFSNIGGGIFICATYKTPKEFTISIKDNGIGMPPEMQAKLFKIQETNTRRGTQNEEGTGIGLLLCKEFIEYHHGSITVVSIENNGCEFIVTIPC